MRTFKCGYVMQENIFGGKRITLCMFLCVFVLCLYTCNTIYFSLCFALYITVYM